MSFVYWFIFLTSIKPPYHSIKLAYLWNLNRDCFSYWNYMKCNFKIFIKLWLNKWMKNLIVILIFATIKFIDINNWNYIWIKKSKTHLQLNNVIKCLMILLNEVQSALLLSIFGYLFRIGFKSNVTYLTFTRYKISAIDSWIFRWFISLLFN